MGQLTLVYGIDFWINCKIFEIAIRPSNWPFRHDKIVHIISLTSFTITADYSPISMSRRHNQHHRRLSNLTAKGRCHHLFLINAGVIAYKVHATRFIRGVLRHIFIGFRRKSVLARDYCSNFLFFFNQLVLQAIKVGTSKLCNDNNRMPVLLWKLFPLFSLGLICNIAHLSKGQKHVLHYLPILLHSCHALSDCVWHVYFWVLAPEAILWEVEILHQPIRSFNLCSF